MNSAYTGQFAADKGSKSAGNARTLDIKGMTGHICVGKVKDALATVAGVKVSAVEVGKAEIVCNDASACQAAVAAINSAGFEAGDSTITSAAISAENMVSEGGVGPLAPEESSPEVRTHGPKVSQGSSQV